MMDSAGQDSAVRPSACSIALRALHVWWPIHAGGFNCASCTQPCAATSCSARTQEASASMVAHRVL